MLSLVLLVLMTFSAFAQTESQQFYELKIYNLKTEEQSILTEGYLKDAYLPALKKMDIGPVGVFRPKKEENDSIKRVYVLTSFDTLKDFEMLDQKLSKDKKYLSQASAYLRTTAANPPYARIETILIKAFEEMPRLAASPLTGNRTERVYELRSYQSPNETYFKSKVKMFNAGGEIELFKELGFNAVFYGEVLAGPVMPNLMYMTTFANQEERDAHWKAFGSSPEWEKLKEIEEYQDNVSHIDILYLYPTEYSEY